MIKITLTTTKQIKNPNTKTTYLTESVETAPSTIKEHGLSTSKDTQKWFRRLGGSESATYGYTCAGYLVTQLVSTSPDRQKKTIREYTFTSN